MCVGVARQEVYMSRFMAEAALMVGLKHPNLQGLFGEAHMIHAVPVCVVLVGGRMFALTVAPTKVFTGWT